MRFREATREDAEAVAKLNRLRKNPLPSPCTRLFGPLFVANACWG
jgi:hypothetical protein